MNKFAAGLSLVMAGLIIGCGTPSPDGFSVSPLEDPARKVTLSDFKGKTVLLDFWATWCGPCRSSMPEVQEVWTRYKDRGLQVVSISDESAEVVKSFHAGSGFTYPVYLDPEGAANRAFGVNGIPRFVLVRDAKVLWDQEGYGPGTIRENVEAAFR